MLLEIWKHYLYLLCLALFLAARHVLHLRSLSWMRQTPWHRQRRLLLDGPWRRSLAPPASASSVTTSAGQLISCSHQQSIHSHCVWLMLTLLCMCTFVCLFFRIIEPLTSRCSKFRFKPLANQVQEDRLLDICAKENLKYTKEVKEKKHIYL